MLTLTHVYLRFRPNEVTLVCVLSACSNSGLVGKGMEIFRSMKEKYQVEANKEHYACVKLTKYCCSTKLSLQ